MGWWKCNPQGGIDWDNKPSGHPGVALINAIPDRDTQEDYYNGDAPADAMFIPEAMIKKWFLNIEPKPTTEQLTDLFIDKKFDPIFQHICLVDLFKLIDETWRRVDEIYMENWNRPTYPEERVYVCLFSFGGANRTGKDWPDYWGLKANDLRWVENYQNGGWLS